METLRQLQDHVETKLFGLLVMEKKEDNIGVEMVEKMRGSKPTKMKNTDYRELKPCILESPVRSKKHVCLFGSPKFPSEMELSDMRR